MKKLLLIVALLTAGLTHAQIIADGGFENGSSGTDWIQSSTNFGTPLCDGGCGNCGGACGANGGIWYAWFGGANAVEQGAVEQSVTIPAGSSTAILSMEVFMPEAGPGVAQDRLEISMDGTILETITALDSNACQVYTTLDIDVLTYADGNAHTLKLEGFQSTTASFNILVDDVDLVVTTAPTEANFSASVVNVSIGQPVDFTDMSSGNITAWDWTFTGATTTSSTAQNPTGIIYNTVGCYDVELTVTSSSGTDTETKTCYINVTCPPFASFFGYSANGLVVDFTNLSVGAESYLWDFGNGSTSVAPNPLWTYTMAGTYTVTLIATDSDCSGTTDTYSINITVAPGETSGDLSVETTEGGETIVAHPNPSNGFVQISNVKPSSEYSLMNIEGKVLSTGQFGNTQELIDLSPYDEGIYYLKTNGVSLKLVKAN